MFEQVVEKNFTLSNWSTAVAVSSGSVSELGLNYSKIGPLIHGQYVFQTVGAVSATFVLPIKSYFGITLQESAGAHAPISCTFGKTAAGYVSVTGSVLAATSTTCRFIGSDSRTMTANDAKQSRSLTLNQGKYFKPPLSANAGTLTYAAAWYQYAKYPIKLILGTVTSDQAATIKFATGAGTKVFESWLASNTTSATNTVVSGVPTSGGVTFAAAAAGTHTFLLLLRERGL